MSHLRVLICRVEDEDDQMTELASVDLPAVRARRSAEPLDTLETHVATVGQRLLAALCAVQWEEVDTHAVAEYCATQEPGSVWADGDETLQVASRFGTLQLRRQVMGRRDGRGPARWPTGPLGLTSCRPRGVRLFSRRSLRLAQGLDFHYHIIPAMYYRQDRSADLMMTMFPRPPRSPDRGESR